MADCEDFTITLQNSTDAEIKATKFEYKDGSNWKTENMFGLDGFKKIDKDNHVDFKRNLQGTRPATGWRNEHGFPTGSRPP